MFLLSKRNIAYDLLRLLAILGVIFIHVLSFFAFDFSRFTPATENLVKILRLPPQLVIALFFIVSGALTLSHPKHPSIFYRQQLLRLGFPLTFWWAISHFFHFPTQHFWFLFALLSFQLLTPIVWPWLQKANRRELFLVIAAVLCWSELLSWLTFATKSIWLFQQSFLPYFGTYLLGYYLAHYPPRCKNSTLMLVLGLIWLWGVLEAIFFGNIAPWRENHALINILAAATTFLLVSNLTRLNPLKKFQLGLTALAKNNLGIYLLHYQILEWLTPLVWGNFHIAFFALNTLVKSIILTFVTFALSYVATLLIKTLPYGKFFVGAHTTNK